MTTQLIAPVIPSLARPTDCGRALAAAARRLPLAAVPEIPAAAEDVLYGLGRIDASGRVADRAVISALGWQAGDQLTFSAAAGVVIARRDPAGMVTMPAKPYLASGCTPRPPAAAAARWPCARPISTRTSAWSCCGRRARRCAGNQSPPR